MKSKSQMKGESLSQMEQAQELSKKESVDERKYRQITLQYGLKDWNERSGQGIGGTIVYVHGKYQVEVEIPQLPGNTVYFTPVADFEFNDKLLNRTVIGDDGPGGFIIRVLCLDDVKEDE